MIKTILIAVIRGYRFALSPWVGNACRYWPTCSEYSMLAIERYGALRGSWMMLARLARCHPYSAGGVDPVPLRFTWRCWCHANKVAAPPRSSSIDSAHEH
jgi:putative membrane protein insertion efficiency factor